MGTHPIFESDFDCLTEGSDSKRMSFQLAHVAAELIGESDLLKRVFFASCCAFERVYLHGGCLEPEGKLPQPLGDVLLFDAKTMSVGCVESQTPAPRLCKHEMSAIGNRLLIVGGWDGYKRRHHCWFFDIRARQWTLLRENLNLDPEQAPAGLSSHAIAPLNRNTFVVTGREGSVRYQKRFGSIFTLSVDENELSFRYTRSSHQIDSRSGHSASIVPSFTRSARKSAPAVLVIGGRNAEHIDSIPLKCYPDVVLPEFDLAQDETMSSTRFKLNPAKTAFRLHACCVVNNWVILHGGRVFNKMRDDVIGEQIIIYDSACSRWFSANIKAAHKLDLKRFGHSLSSIGGQLYILGGAVCANSCTGQMIRASFQT